MSIKVPLELLPNQSLTIELDSIRYGLRFHDLGGMMSVDISINDELIIEGQRCVGSDPLIPYRYLKADGGNFFFLTELGDIVYWDKFGMTQSLIYLTAEELSTANGN
tara:strand:- start:173 stop:493 length:321 start_codon:yes stop_codon:yes gene_type:complete